MRVSNYAIFCSVFAFVLVFSSIPTMAQDGGNALLNFERHGYVKALGESDPRVQGLDKRMELQCLGFRNPDIRTSTASAPTRSRHPLKNAMVKMIADGGEATDCYLGITTYLWTPHGRVYAYLPSDFKAQLEPQ